MSSDEWRDEFARKKQAFDFVQQAKDKGYDVLDARTPWKAAIELEWKANGSVAADSHLF